MNDKTITKIIAKIHFNLLAAFFVLFLVGFFVFVALLEGFTISHLKLGDIRYEGLYLKWDKRLTVSASLIDLSELHSDNEPLTLKPLSKITDTINNAQRWISTIDINTIQYDNIRLSLHYSQNGLGRITINYNKVHLDGNFTLSPELLQLSLASQNDEQVSITGSGNLYLQKEKLDGNLQIKLPNTPTLSIYAIGDQKKVQISAKADQPFTTLTEIVDFLNVDPQTRPWITQYARANRITLNQCYASFTYDQPQRVLQSLTVQATVEQAQYTFAPDFAPIIAPKVDLIFKNGVLGIYPRDGHFYTTPTQKSHLFIDFNPPHAQLKAHISTDHAQLNDPLLNLLHYYEIKVPIRQNKGYCNVDLNLTIDLNNFKTTAKGRFVPGKSELKFQNYIFQTMGGIVTLDTTKVAFYGFDAQYQNLLHAKVKGAYDAHTEQGNVQIAPITCTPTGDSSSLCLSEKPLTVKAVYHINPHDDRLQILPTQWKILGETLNVDGFSIPYDFNKSNIVIPNIHYWVPNQVQGSLNGIFSSDGWRLNMGIDHFNAKDLLLRNKDFALTLTGTQKSVNIISDSTSAWKLNDQDFSLSPFKFTLVDKKLQFNNITVIVDTIMQGTLSGDYLFNLNKGSLLLNNIVPLNPYIGGYVKLNKSEEFLFATADNQLALHSQSMGVDFSTMEHGWKITVPDISLLSSNSPLLNQYQITNGHADLFYYPSQKRYTFNGIIDYPYHLMTVNNESLSRYQFSGTYQNGRSSIRVNNRLQIDYGDDITIKANNMGINAPELARWLNMPHPQEETKKSSVDKTINLNATNVYLYLMKNRRVMADSLTATLGKSDLEARLTYAQGSADLLMKDGLYYVNGSHFNDSFMEHLFAFSDFDGGEMSFQMSGKIDDFEGIMRIENTTLKEYKLLNNVLSFINTVPSLATFSLPNYNSKGLLIKESYSHYTFKNHLLTIDNFTLNSPELKMLGESKMNFKEDSIAGALTLKSDLGSKLGRIPVVGYILLGNDGSISTTVNLKGKLSDPVVETAIAKEIITAPFNILKRTITYPFLWMMDDKKK